MPLLWRHKPRTQPKPQQTRFAGNKPETQTILPVVKAFADRNNVVDMVVVADAGMLSATNLDAIEEAGLRFIVGSRMTKAPRTWPVISTGTAVTLPMVKSLTPLP